MIVITGTQRSGTSFMAKYMKLCGHDVGTDFWDDRINGGLENPDVCNFFRDMLGDNSFPFSKYWELINQRTFKSFHNLDTTVVKFSYLLMLPDLVHKWYQSRGRKDKFIIMYRDLDKVGASKASRKEFMSEDYGPLNQGFEILNESRRLSLSLLDYYDLPYQIIHFPIKDPKQVVETLSEFTKLKLSKSMMEQFFDPSQINF